MQEKMEQAAISPATEALSDKQGKDNESAASVGKFASSEELLKAYKNLEAEFTRKCQQLKESERRSEPAAEVAADAGSAPLYESEEWDDKVAAFLGEYPIAEEYAKDIARLLSEDRALAGRDNCLEIVLGKVLAKNYRRPESIVEDEAFLEEHVYRNDKIRDRVIRDYLEGLSGLAGAPKTLPHGGAAAIIPPSKPRTVAEAGAMAEKMIRSRRI